MCRKSELDTHTKKHQNLTKSSLKFWGGENNLSGDMHRLQSSERLTSIQCERLDHCRHDCCLLETEEPTGAAASQGGERERERLGVAGRGLDYLHPSPSPGAVICFALYALLFTLLMKNSVHVLFGFFFFLNRKSFEFFKMKRNLITYKNQKIH